MNEISIQLNDQANRFISESGFVPFYHTLTPGSSSLSKYGTLIPNRIFVGGIPSNTNEQELKSFFSSFGQVKDVKIINDRSGASKGSYGFVTFESQETAEKIIKNESEKLFFKDRKLNISHAIRRQQLLPRPDLTTALFIAGGTVPYSYQNTMALLPLSVQEYSLLAQTAAPYTTMMLPQLDGGTTIYFPFLNPTLAGNGSPFTHIPQHSVTAALQQQFNQTENASCLAPTNVGQATSINASINSINSRPHSTPAVMTAAAAAAAAMAAVVQWPQHPVHNNQQQSQQSCNVAVTHSASHVNKEYSINHLSAITQHQSTVTAQHPANWFWSPGVQQTQNTIYGTNPQTTIYANDISSCIRVTTSTPTITTSNIQLPQQQYATNTTYLYNPFTGSSHELMLFHQTNPLFTNNSTSDNSTHSSGLMESVESFNYNGTTTLIGRQTQQLGKQFTDIYNNNNNNHNNNNNLHNNNNNTQIDGAYLSPYAATITSILGFHPHSNCMGQSNSIHSMQPTHLQHNLHQNHQTTTLVSIVNQSHPPNKLFTDNNYTRHLSTTIMGNHLQNRNDTISAIDMNLSNEQHNNLISSIDHIQSCCTTGSAIIHNMTSTPIISQSSSISSALATTVTKASSAVSAIQVVLPCLLTTTTTSS
ncbi:unnamed protein product [Schistosoma turkestanicum]|nr:unnamed protein product [Schistosoma turkestanicum]